MATTRTSGSGKYDHCEHCFRKLHPDRITWLELNFVTNRYTDQDVPEDESQGCFPFGKACAKTVLKNGGMW